MKWNVPKNIFLKWVDGSIIVLFFAGILLFLFLTGTVNSGYHFYDDYEVLEIHADLQTKSIVQTPVEWIRADLTRRFRPMYFIHRVLEVKIFGTNFFLLSLYTGILAALTFSFFYISARKLKYSVLESFIFVLLVFIGPQMEVWWALGPNETIGMFFLGLSFFLMVNCVEGKRRLLKNIFFLIFLIAASLSKESFVIIIPAFIFFQIWRTSQIYEISISESIRKNLWMSILIVIMCLELWVIFLVVGTNKSVYAGTTSNIGELIKGFFAIVSDKNMLGRWVELIAVIIIIYIIDTFFRRSINIKNLIWKIIYPFIFSALVVLPNIYLYAKSGMTGRYLLPATLGFAFLIIYLVKNMNNFYSRVISFIIIFIFLIISLKISVKNATYFAFEGIQTNQLLSAIIKNANPESKILVVVDPADQFEIPDSLKIYLAYNGIDNLYVYPITMEYNSDIKRVLANLWMERFRGRIYSNKDGSPDEIIIFDRDQTDKFFSESGLRISDYRNNIGAKNMFLLLIK